MVGLHVDLVEQALDDFQSGWRALDDDGVGDVVGDEKGAADEDGLGSGTDIGIAEGAAATTAAAAGPPPKPLLPLVDPPKLAPVLPLRPVLELTGGCWCCWPGCASCRLAPPVAPPWVEATTAAAATVAGAAEGAGQGVSGDGQELGNGEETEFAAEEVFLAGLHVELADEAFHGDEVDGAAHRDDAVGAGIRDDLNGDVLTAAATTGSRASGGGCATRSGAGADSMRWMPAVFWVACWAVSSVVSVSASSVTSEYLTLMKRVPWTEPGLSISFFSSMSLRMSEVFSVMTTAEAFGTAAMEPKAPNWPMIWVKVLTASAGLM